MTETAPPWRPMRPDDLPEVDRIGSVVHPSYPEALAVLAEKQALYPPGCLILETPAGMLGYVFAHPWTLGRPPALDARLGALPEAPDTLHVHDVALLPEARGAGAAARAVDRLAAAAAAGLRSLSLVAVPAAVPYWERRGFRPAGADVIGYGAGARYLLRELADGR